MERKEVVCKRCGIGGLNWRQSAKGNWYLCDPRPIQTSYETPKWIPFAHRCLFPEFSEEGQYVGLSRELNKEANIANILKGIANLEYYASFGPLLPKQDEELQSLKYYLKKFQEVYKERGE